MTEEISPLRAKALALFASVFNAVFNGIPLVLPSGTVVKPKERDISKEQRELAKKPIPKLNSDVLSRPLPRLQQPPSPRPLGKRHGSKATVQ